MKRVWVILYQNPPFEIGGVVMVLPGNMSAAEVQAALVLCKWSRAEQWDVSEDSAEALQTILNKRG